MATKLLVVSAAILVLGIISETAAQYRNAGYGYGYGHQSHPYYQQPRPPFGGYRQPVYQQQVPGGVSVQEAEWVCKNPKTGDVMIIAVDDSPTSSRNNGPPQWHQVLPQNNQPNNNVKPQVTFGEPTYAPVNPTYDTTENPASPVWSNNNNYQPSQPQVNPTTETHTTTEREPGPIWSTNDENKNNNNNKNKGFTIDDTSTTWKPFQGNPFFNPTQEPKTTTSATNAADDDEPIEIIMGK